VNTDQLEPPIIQAGSAEVERGPRQRSFRNECRRTAEGGNDQAVSNVLPALLALNLMAHRCARGAPALDGRGRWSGPRAAESGFVSGQRSAAEPENRQGDSARRVRPV
jgi:hypothetical protein